jgi:hypothetical protein
LWEPEETDVVPLSSALVELEEQGYREVYLNRNVYPSIPDAIQELEYDLLDEPVLRVAVSSRTVVLVPLKKRNRLVCLVSR